MLKLKSGVDISSNKKKKKKVVLINSDKNNVAPMTNHSKTVVKNINVPYITQKKK